MNENNNIDVSLSFEDWQPLIDWLSVCLNNYPKEHLWLTEEVEKPLMQMLYESHYVLKGQDMNLTLTKTDCLSLVKQLQFWECCIDELSIPVQEIAPNWQCFRCLQFALDGYLLD